MEMALTTGAAQRIAQLCNRRYTYSEVPLLKYLQCCQSILNQNMQTFSSFSNAPIVCVLSSKSMNCDERFCQFLLSSFYLGQWRNVSFSHLESNESWPSTKWQTWENYSCCQTNHFCLSLMSKRISTKFCEIEENSQTGSRLYWCKR